MKWVAKYFTDCISLMVPLMPAAHRVAMDTFSNSADHFPAQPTLRHQLLIASTIIESNYLLITYRAKLLNFLMFKTAAIVGRGHRSQTLPNLLASFFHSPTFWKHSLTTPSCSSCFHFCSRLLILRYIPRQLSRNETPLLQKNNFSIE